MIKKNTFGYHINILIFKSLKKDIITKRYFLFFLGISVILYLGINLTSDLHVYMDLDLGDEMGYINSSKTNYYFAHRSLYPLWYKLISYYSTDNIDLFFLNQKILIILTPICLFILLFSLFENFVACLFFSCLFLYSNTNIATEFIYNDLLIAVVNNKINNFTLCIICLLGCSITFYKKQNTSTISLLTISFFILSYCRNEFCILYIICMTIYIYQYFRILNRIPREKYLFLYFVVISICAIKFWGLSILTSGYSNLHYMMSYSRNYLEWNDLPMSGDSDIISPCLYKFGKHESLTGFLFSNPIAFMKNILYNIYNMFFINSFRLADIFLPQVFIKYIDKSIFNYCIVILFISLLISVYIFLIKDKKMFLEQNLLIKYFIIPAFLINISTNLIYYFEPRSFIFFVPLILIITIALLDKLRNKKTIQYFIGILILLIVLLKPSIHDYYTNNNYKKIRNVSKTVKIIDEYIHGYKKNNIKILSNCGNYDVPIPGVNTSEYNFLTMAVDSNFSRKYNNLDTFDIFIVYETKPIQSYLWFERVTDYLDKNKDNFNSFIVLKYLNFSEKIYLRK